MSQPRRGLPTIAVLTIVGLSIAACNQSGRPRPGDPGYVPGWGQGAISGQQTLAGANSQMRDYTALPGDTVYGVAGRFGIPIRTLIEINGLSAPFQLTPGQHLAIPARKEHIVQPGETVFGIARAYGIDQSTLMRINGIQPPYVIRAGERLRLPAPVQTASVQRNEAAVVRPVPSKAPMTVETLPAPGGPAAPAAKPPMSAPQTAAPSPPATASRPAPQTAPIPLPLPPAANAPSDPAASPQVQQRTAAAPPPAARAIPAAVPKAPPRSSGKFLWPVNGRVISGFGPKDGGLHNDGINIAAPRGAPVRAAENGVVAYAGNELRGFGNLLLIRHADGWISAYAHNDALLVQRGDQVTRGQTIARVGSSGSVSTPQLHFELRRGTRSIDPMKHLGSQGAALNPAAFRGAPPDLG